jgi:hypothetical protein
VPDRALSGPYHLLHRHAVADELRELLGRLGIHTDNPDVWPTLGADRQWDGHEVLYLGSIPLSTAEQLVTALRGLTEQAEQPPRHKDTRQPRGQHADR